MKCVQLTVLLLLEALLFTSLGSSSTHVGGNDITYAQYPDISGIKCDKVEHFSFHYHAHLNIFINGISYLVPADIGIKPPECIYWLHTHDVTGLIHVESPENKTFNLGQFFDIWDKKFNNSQIFDFAVNKSDSKSLVVYVNRTAVNDLQYRDIPIVNHEDITIVYGSPPAEIASYNFSY